MLERRVFGAVLQAVAEDEACENLMIFKNEVDILRSLNHQPLRCRRLEIRAKGTDDRE